MRYLSFDIECCDGVHICEFGYVISDTNYNVLEKEVFVINPEKPFNLTGRPDQDDLKLFFTEETYNAGKTFPFYYAKIKSLLEYEDQIVIGHAVINDAGFLRTACKHYKLNPINFSFFDSQKVYTEYSNQKKDISLESAGELFHLDKPKYLHKSDDDALLTLQMMQKISESLSISLSDLRDLCPTANGSSHNFCIKYTGSSLPEMLEALSKNINSLSNKRKAECIKQFAEKVEPRGAIINSILSGCQLCFSLSFEKNNIKDALVLIQLMADHSCRYCTKVLDDDYYVATQEELALTEIPIKSRYYAAKSPNRECKIISFEELYGLLSVTEQDVKNAPWPKIEKKQVQQKKKEQLKKTTGNTIGDQLKAKGIDLIKLFK